MVKYDSFLITLVVPSHLVDMLGRKQKFKLYALILVKAEKLVPK